MSLQCVDIAMIFVGTQNYEFASPLRPHFAFASPLLDLTPAGPLDHGCGGGFRPRGQLVRHVPGNAPAPRADIVAALDGSPINEFGASICPPAFADRS